MATERLNFNFTASETVSKAVNNIKDSVDDASRSLSSMQREFAESTLSSEAFEQGQQSAARAIERVHDNAGQASRSVSTLSQAEMASSASAATASVSQRSLANAIDKAGDEAREAAVEMSVMDAVMKNLSISAGGLSFNMGAFTIALRNVGTQIPLLVTSIGSLVAILGSLITVATGATVALGGLLAGGIIARAQELEESFAGIEDQAQALQVIMEGIRDVFITALDPLIVEENIEVFRDFVNFIAGVVNRFAQATAQMRGMFLGFADDIAVAIDTNLNDIFSSFQLLFEEVGPILQDLIIFFIEHLPGAMDFFRRVTTELIGPISEFADQFRELVVELVDFAAAAGQGVIPVLTGLVRAFTNLVATLNEFSSIFTGTVAQLAVGAVVLGKMVSMTNDVVGVLIPLAGTFNTVFLEATSASGALSNVNAQLQGLFAQRLGNLANLGTLLKLTALEGLTLSEAFEEIQEAADDAGDEITETAAKIQALKKLGAGQTPLIPLSNLRPTVDTSEVSFEGAEGRIQEALREGIDIEAGEVGTVGGLSGVRARPGTSIRRTRVGQRDPSALPVLASTFEGVGDISAASDTPELDSVRKKLDKIRNSGGTLAKTLKNSVTNAVVGSATAFAQFSNTLAASIKSVAMSIKTVIIAFAQYIRQLWASVVAQISAAASSGGFAAGLKTLAANAWGAVTSFGALVAGALASAASFLVGAASAVTLGTALNVALAGIPAIIGAIVVASGLLVGVLGNMDGIAGGLKASFSTLKAVLRGLFDVIVTIGVPAWNLMVNAVELIINGLLLLPNLLIEALKFIGLLGDDASALKIAIDGLTIAFSVLGDVVGFVVDLIADTLRGISGLIDAVNKFIDFGGSGDQLSGLQTSESKVRENVSGVGDEPEKDDFATRPNPNLSIKNETNNNVEQINARPEDKQRIKNLVKDAMEEANTFRRQKDAFSG